MSKLRDNLRADARLFMENVSEGHQEKDAVEVSLDRLLAWSEKRLADLFWRKSEGKDHLVGVSRTADGPAIWRVFPRRDGGKVCLVPGARHYLAKGTDKVVAEILGSLNGRQPIEHGKQFDQALSRIATEDSWAKYEVALDLVFDAMTPATKSTEAI